MEFTPQQKKEYRSRYIQLANSGVVKDYRLDFGILWDKSQSLVNEIMKHPKMKGLIKSSEIFSIINTSFIKLHQSHKDSGDFKFVEKMTIVELETAADKFINLLEGLPYEHFFYFRLSFELAENIFSIKLTENVELIRPLKAEKDFFILPPAPNSIAEALLGYPSFKADENSVFFKVRVLGYGDEAQTRAVTALKQFLYLADASGLLTSRSWDRRTSRFFENNKFKAPSLEGELQSFTLSSEIALYISGLKLDSKRFEGFEPTKDAGTRSLLGGSLRYKSFEDFFKAKFLEGCRNFINIHDEKKTIDRNHIFSAIEWGFDGSANPNETMGFIQVCIGLEALLGDKDEKEDRSQRSLIEKLADRCAYLLKNTPNGRKVQAEEFRKIYKLRSKLVHGVWPKVTDEQSQVISTAAFLLKKLVYQELWLSGQSE